MVGPASGGGHAGAWAWGPALLPQGQMPGHSKALSSKSCHLGAPAQSHSKAEDRAVLLDPRHTRLATV